MCSLFLSIVRFSMGKITVYCGAGVSVDSGLPTFRGGEGALWNDHVVSDICDYGAWRRAVGSEEQTRINNFYEDYRRRVLAAEPNAFHRYMAALDAMVITTNVDDLFERAGSSSVVHLHGSIHHLRCISCNHIYAATSATPQRCSRDRCRSRFIKTDVRFYGETCAATYLPGIQAFNRIKTGDVLIMAGSSGATFAVGRDKWARIAGGGRVKTIQVNPDPEVLALYPAAIYIQAGASESIAQLASIIGP